MSPRDLMLLSACALVSPWLLMTARRPRPEIHGALRLLWSLNALYCALWHRLDVRGMAPLPEHGPAILISNHTSGADPPVLQAGCRRVLGFLIAREFYEYWAFQPLCRLLGCIPVERNGRDLAATRSALRALKAGRVVPIFPEGRILPTSGRELGEPRPGAAFIVLHARVPVIPAYIWGTPATTQIWAALLTPSRAHVRFGPPLDLSDVDPEQPITKTLLAAVSERLMGAIRDLKAKADAGDGTPDAGTDRPEDAVDARRRPPDRPDEVSRDRPTLLRA